MNSVYVILLGLMVFAFGYRWYGAKLSNLFHIDPQLPTPSKTQYDGVDYVPARNWLVLFGHHFSSIAGAGPIIGPVLACCIWGWAPALLWVLFGSILFGGVHDFGALAVSVKEKGSSISAIASDVISKRASILFSLFVWLALILVIGVFLYLCADTFVQEPAIVLPSLGLIPVAMLVGYLLYVKKMNQVFATILGLVLLTALIAAGQFITFKGPAVHHWALLLIIYCFIASILPVNILLQPRDYLSSFLLFFGLGVGLIGAVVSRRAMELPAFTGFGSPQGGLWPMLFVIVACGAISGFHCLISSGTTSKQIANERHIKRIGFGAMMVEGLVAVMVIVAIGAGLGKQCLLEQGSPVMIFGKGYGVITRSILFGYGGITAIMILNAFILTTLDTATRITRYITEELFFVRNRFISTGIVVAAGGWLALAKDASGAPLWKLLWPAFGASNQLVAALALFVISCWLLARKKPTHMTLIPAIGMLVTTLAALIYQALQNIRSHSYLLFNISVVLIILALIMTFEVINVFRKKGLSQ